MLRKPSPYIGRQGGRNLGKPVKVESALKQIFRPIGKLLLFFFAALDISPPHKSIVGWEFGSERRPLGGWPHRVEGARCDLPASNCPQHIEAGGQRRAL
jgi:hypothetical protein